MNKDIAKFRSEISTAAENLVLTHGTKTAIQKAFRAALAKYASNGKVTFGDDNAEKSVDFSFTASLVGTDGVYYDVVVYYATCRKKGYLVVTEVDLIA